jgi:choline kinase
MVQGRTATRQTVILAAGFGSRLATARGELPKPLVHVAGRPLIEHALDQAAAAGVEEAVIVTGNSAALIESHLARLDTPLTITPVYNPRFHEPNGVSLLAAAPVITGQFYLQMADHLFDQPVLRQLDAATEVPAGCMRLLVDCTPGDLDEEDATKVRVQERRISHIGKDVYPYDAVDTGCFLLDPRVFEALEEVARTEPPSVTLGMRRLIARGQFAAVPIQGTRWMDVDTPDDYAKAERLLAGLRLRPSYQPVSL